MENGSTLDLYDADRQGNRSQVQPLQYWPTDQSHVKAGKRLRYSTFLSLKPYRRDRSGGGDRRCCKFKRRCRRDGPAEIEMPPAFGFGETPTPLMFIAQSDIVGAVLVGIVGRCAGSTTLGATSAAPFAVRVVLDAIAPVIVSARRRLIVS